MGRRTGASEGVSMNSDDWLNSEHAGGRPYRYMFAAWNTAAGGLGAKLTIIGNETLHAQWGKIIYQHHEQ